MTREELLDRMTIEEFHMWIMLEHLEPYGEYGEWLRSGLVCATMANINRGKNQRAFTPQDFMPEAFSPRKKTETVKSMKDKWIAIMNAQNAIVGARKAESDARTEWPPRV